MSGRTILNVEKPNTQSVKAVCALLAWKGRSSNPLPSFVEIGSGEARVVLVLSNKKDSYYTCTKSDCSCPAAIYQRGPCKHRRKYFSEQTIHKQSIEETLREADANLHKMPYQYQRMVRASRETADSPLELMGGHKPFRPIIEDEVGQKSCTTKTVSSSPLYVDCLPDPTARDLAYHSIQEDKILWPVEA